jgi:predicted HTH transcriptional regulator
MNDLLKLWGQGKSSGFEVTVTCKKSVSEWIEIGTESRSVEFKSSYEIEPSTGERRSYLQHAVLKVLASFANSGGGTLIIGVTDDGDVLGVDAEIQALRAMSRTGRAELPILIRDFVKKETSPKGKYSLSRPDYLLLDLEKCGGKKVLVARVFQTPRPIWMLQKPSGNQDRGKWVVYQRLDGRTEIHEESSSPPDA